MLLRDVARSIPGGRRTRWLGRVARLALLAIFAGSLYSIVDGSGSARFRNPHILTEPSAWILHITMLIVFVILVGTVTSTLVAAPLVRRIQVLAVAALVGSAMLAALIGQVADGSVWGFPLADFVWWFDVAMLVAGTASTALAIVLGTPGCEFGVVTELVARFRHIPTQSADPSPCILGLHALDEWEHRRSELG